MVKVTVTGICPSCGEEHPVSAKTEGEYDVLDSDSYLIEEHRTHNNGPFCEGAKIPPDLIVVRV